MKIIVFPQHETLVMIIDFNGYNVTLKVPLNHKIFTVLNTQIYIAIIQYTINPVGSSCRVHRQHLCREIRSL